jgi:hypothetical protein
MLGNVKALIVVLAIAATVFRFAKPIALRFMSGEDFSRRRLIWLVLTIACFLSPNFWLYVLVAVPLLIWANRRESNPVALYLLILHVVPPVGVIIPILGNNGLFPLDNYRVLALCLLLPAAIRHRKNRDKGAAGGWGAMDVLLLSFIALEVALYIPPDFPHHPVIPDSPTNFLRRLILCPLDVYLLYFTVSRTCDSRHKMLDAAATLCLACGLLAAIAIFENLRGWLLYTDLASHWANDPALGFYLVREGSVRAQVSAGHSIALGNMLAVGFGVWLYLKSHVRSGLYRVGVTLLLCGGLYATSSRGAWLGAAVVYFIFLAAGPRAVSRLATGALLALAMAGLILLSPIGDRMLQMLPGTGKPADFYRYRLAERGWQVVMAHPFFGDQYPWPELEDLRQGEGIIDIVNTYLGVALNYGLIGLSVFLSFILLGMALVYVRSRRLAQSDPDLALFGASLIACIGGILVMLDSNGFGMGLQKMFYVLAGLAAAYAKHTGSLRSSPAAGNDSHKLQGAR